MTTAAPQTRKRSRVGKWRRETSLHIVTNKAWACIFDPDVFDNPADIAAWATNRWVTLFEL